MRTAAPLLLLALALGLVRTAIGAPIRSAEATTATSWPYVAAPDGGRLFPLDPLTLAISSDPAGSFAPPTATGVGAPGYTAWLASADGSTLVRYAVDLSAGTGHRMGTAAFTVFDVATGAVRSEFDAPEWGQQIPQLSADGSVLVIEAGAALVHETDGALAIAEQPIWYAFDTRTGTEIARVQGDGNALAGLQRLGFLDPTGSRLYRLVALGQQEATGPWPTQVVAVDLRSGRETGRIDLPGVVSGFWTTGAAVAASSPNTSYAGAYLTPSFAATPDGGTVIVLDADGANATVVDAATLSVRSRQTTGLIARRTWTIPHASADGCSGLYPLCLSAVGAEVQALAAPDERHLLVGGYAAARTGPDEITVTDYGLQLVSLETGSVVAQATVPQSTVLAVQFEQRKVWPALDGTAYYVLGLQPDLAASSLATPIAADVARLVLFRFDAIDLALTAEQDITDVGSASVVVLAQPLPSTSS